MDYIEAPKDATSSNPFATLPKLGDDRAALIVHRGAAHYIVMNRFPYNGGHLLVVPYREVAELEDLTPNERDELMALIVFGKRVLQKALKPDGFNAGIPKHLHAHIVPRWNGDTNFMPVIGQTRVLPQALTSLYDRLQAIAAELAASKPAAT
jgi:ATP adenylyltransferase